MLLSNRVTRIEAAYGVGAAEPEPYRWGHGMSVAENEHMKSLHDFFSGLGESGLDKLLADIAQHGGRLVRVGSEAA